MDDLRRNGSGYSDPTAYKAIKRAEKDKKSPIRKLLLTLYNVAHLAGYEVVKIKIRNTKTGETFEE